MFQQRASRGGGGAANFAAKTSTTARRPLTTFAIVCCLVFALTQVRIHNIQRAAEDDAKYVALRRENIGANTVREDGPPIDSASAVEPQTDLSPANRPPPQASAKHMLTAEPVLGAGKRTPPLMNHVTLHKPLVAALTDYEYLHKRWVDEAPKDHLLDDARYVIVTPTGQICNRLRAILSGFLFALLSNRAIIVFWDNSHAEFYDLFERPGFSLVKEDSMDNLDTLMALSPDSDIVEYTEEGYPRHSPEAEQDFINSITCRDFRETMSAKKIVKISGARWLASFMVRNPHYEHLLRDWFTDGDIARPLAKHLLQPVQPVFDMLDRFAARTGWDTAPFRISFHIRTEFDISAAEWAAYWKCAIASTPEIHREDAVWFVATDSGEARANVVDVFGANASKEVMFLNDEFQKANSIDGQRLALADLLLASNGDRIFTTPFSSFGRFIGIFAPSTQVFVISDGGEPAQDPHFHRTPMDGIEHCSRFISKQPCAWKGDDSPFLAQIRTTECFTPDMVYDYC